MTVCNMSIEAGARAGMIAPDDTTFAYLEGRDHAPKGAAWEEALADWRSLPTDEGATFDREVHLDASTLAPYVTWGTNPAQVTRIDGSVPDPAAIEDDAEQEAADRALEYMGLVAGTPIHDIAVDTVFIGSCTNGRIEDLRAAADGAAGPEGPLRPAGHGRPRLPPGQGPGRVGGAGRGVHRGRLRLASARLLDVPGHEPRQAGPRRAGGVDVQPQLRGPTGTGRSHPPGLPRRGRRHRGGRPLRLTRGARLMKAMQLVSGRAVPLDRSDVDTDQIIPSDWLKRVERTGFGAGLFAEWRDDRDFVLNQEEYAGATILVAGPNFGTGSSTGARRVGPAGLRVRGGGVSGLRRHLPQQLHQGRAGARPGRRPRPDGCCSTR